MSISRDSAAGPVGGGIGVIALGAFAAIGYLGCLYVPVMATMAWDVILQVLREPFKVADHTWQNVVWDSVFGLLVGLAVGLLRYVFRIRKDVVDNIAEALWKPDAVALGKVGLFVTHLLFHAACGALSGFVMGLIGLVQLPDLAFGDILTFPVAGTAAADLLVRNGFFVLGGAGSGGGGGGFPPDASPFLAMAVIALVAMCVVWLASMLSAAGFAVLGRALLAGASDGFFKNLGSSIVLFLTRWWDRYCIGGKLPKFESEHYQQYPEDALSSHLCHRGWFWRALRRGTWAGMTVGVLNLVLSLVCLIVARAWIQN